MHVRRGEVTFRHLQAINLHPLVVVRIRLNRSAMGVQFDRVQFHPSCLVRVLSERSVVLGVGYVFPSNRGPIHVGLQRNGRQRGRACVWCM